MDKNLKKKIETIFCWSFVAALLIFGYYKLHQRDVIIINGSNATFYLRHYIDVQKLSVQRDDISSFSDNFRNLYYNDKMTRTFSGRIKKDFADAYLIDNVLRKTPTLGEPRKAPFAFRGYFFQEDFLGRINEEYPLDRLPFMAFPEEYGITGDTVLWIDIAGVVKYNDPKVRKGTKGIELIGYYINNTPLSENPTIKWSTL